MCRIYYTYVKFFVVLIKLILLQVIVACSEDYNDYYSIRLQNNHLPIEIGVFGNVDFWIIPPKNATNMSFVPDIDVSIVDCSLGNTPLHCRLYNVERIATDDSEKYDLHYRLYIEDLRQRINYEDTVRLDITILNQGEAFSVSSSVFYLKHNSEILLNEVLGAGLPTLIFETVGGELPSCDYVNAPQGCNGWSISNETKVPGRLYIYDDRILTYDSGYYFKGASGCILKIRGNTSAYGEKKPYKIKLQSSFDLLNRGYEQKYSDKEWILVDYDCLKYLVGFKINELIGMLWTPRYQYVNVIINGDYRGLYMLIESVKRNVDCRLNVSKTGYIVEFDPYWWNEDLYVESSWFPSNNYGMNYTFKYPDDEKINEEVFEYIYNYIHLFEERIRDNRDWEQLLDIESWAKWILAHDLLGTGDGAGSNTFMVKYDNTMSTKLMMGNLWDFDSIYMNYDSWATVHGWDRQYFYKLFEYSSFVNEYKNSWIRLSGSIIDDIIFFLDEYKEMEIAKNLNKSIYMDNLRWQRNNPLVDMSVDEAILWFKNRQVFMNKHVLDM